VAEEPDFAIKAHDRLPVIRAQLMSDEDVPEIINLTGNLGIKFIMREADVDWNPLPGLPVIEAAATVVVPLTEGIVEYAWDDGDTAVPGRYVAEWEVVFSNGKAQTFPTTSYHTIEIPADLNDA
jgi:hypothetical protein